MEKFDAAAGSPESDQSRDKRLVQLADTLFPELDFSDRDNAANRLRTMENDLRDTVGDPSLRINSELIEPEAKLEIALAIERDNQNEELKMLAFSVADNNVAIEESEKQLSVSNDNRKTAHTNKDHLKNSATKTEDNVRDSRDDLDIIESHAVHFENLKAKYGLVPALEMLLEPSVLNSPKMIALVRRVLTIAKALPKAILGKEKIITRLLNESKFDLTANSVAGAFGGFMSAVESSDALSSDDKATLRAVVLDEEYIKRGSQVRQVARETITDPQTGLNVPRYTSKKPKLVRDGVETFTDPNQQKVMIRFAIPNQSPVEYDVTTWGDSDIGLLTEALGFAIGLQSTGLDILADLIAPKDQLLSVQKPDRSHVQRMRKVMSALLGGFEAFDGDIFDSEERAGLLRYQARLLTPSTGEVANQSVLAELGILNAEGELDLDALGRFGRIARNSFGLREITHEEMRERLRT